MRPHTEVPWVRDPLGHAPRELISFITDEVLQESVSATAGLRPFQVGVMCPLSPAESPWPARRSATEYVPPSRPQLPELQP